MRVTALAQRCSRLRTLFSIWLQLYDRKEAACIAGKLPAEECVDAWDYYNPEEESNETGELEDLEMALGTRVKSKVRWGNPFKVLLGY